MEGSSDRVAASHLTGRSSRDSKRREGERVTERERGRAVRVTRKLAEEEEREKDWEERKASMDARGDVTCHTRRGNKGKQRR